MNEPLDQFLEVCRNAAVQGGQILEEWAGRFAVREKGPADLVTEADLASQAAVREILLSAFPDHGFLGEEPGANVEGRGGYRWIVDPLDGTTNYVHGLAQYCVSIALERDGRLLVGAVYDPRAEECFHATMAGGAFCNDRPIRTSSVAELSQALAVVSFAPRVARHDPSVHEFLNVVESAQAVRRMGSSALNLCYLAAGRVDAYWARDTKAWDVAAGFLLVAEAGGAITSYDGGPANLAQPRFIAAATQALHSELCAAIRMR